MIQYRLEGGGSAARGWPAFLLIGVGVVFLVSGLALLAVIVAAAAVIGAGVLAFRRLTGRSLPRSAARATDGLELEPDFVILPATPAVDEPAKATLPSSTDRAKPSIG